MALVVLLAMPASAVVVGPATLLQPQSVRPRSLCVAMAKDNDGWTFDTSKRRERSKAPEAKKADDKSWGLGEFFSGWGQAPEEPDTGPKLGGRRKAASKASKDPYDPSRYDRRLPADSGKSSFKFPWDK
jgi:hypothetical protein